jgi:hypothetical protein
MPQGTTLKLVTPGPNHKHYLAGALEPQSGRLGSCTSLRNTNTLFRMLRDRLEGRYPQTQFATVSVVVDNSAIHKARAVERGLAAPPRFELLFLPTSCPPANPIEGSVAMSMITVRAITNAPALRLWDKTLNPSSRAMGRGPPTARPSITLQQ